MIREVTLNDQIFRFPTSRFPEESGSDDIDDEFPFAQYPEPAPRDREDPFNGHGPNYKWPKLPCVDRNLLGPWQEAAWELRCLNVEARATMYGPGP